MVDRCHIPVSSEWKSDSGTDHACINALSRNYPTVIAVMKGSLVGGQENEVMAFELRCE